MAGSKLVDRPVDHRKRGSHGGRSTDQGEFQGALTHMWANPKKKGTQTVGDTGETLQSSTPKETCRSHPISGPESGVPTEVD